jgi:hypothetical protein
LVWLVGFFLLTAIGNAGRERAESAAAPDRDPVDQVRRLAELRDEGVISEEEFQDKKETLLRRIE